jgi:hypothetical protein
VAALCAPDPDRATDTGHDEPTEVQLEVASALAAVLTRFFPIETLGGHREFAKRKGSSRACPGAYGMIIAAQLSRGWRLCLSITSRVKSKDDSCSSVLFAMG